TRMLAAGFSKENHGMGGLVLCLAFCLLYFTNTVLSSAFGAQPSFVYYLYYAPFFFLAVFVSRGQGPELTVRFLKLALLGFLAASLVLALVAPDLTIQRWYDGRLPGIDFRFWGLDRHPNAMAPMALLYLLLALHQPFERRWLQRLGLVAGLAVLFLTQSATTWTAAAIALPTLLILRSLVSPPAERRRAMHTLSKVGLALPWVLALGMLGAI